MAWKLWLQLVLAAATFLLVTGKKDEFVLKVAPNKAKAGSDVTVTCGVKESGPNRKVFDIYIAVPNVPPFSWKMYPVTSSNPWTCESNRYVSHGDVKFCKTPIALLLRFKAQPQYEGQINCTAISGPVVPQKAPRINNVTKTADLKVYWPARLDYMWIETNLTRRRTDEWVFLGRVNVSCGFILSSKGTEKPTMTGLDSWAEVKQRRPGLGWGYKQVHMKRTKVITLADNGTDIECAIGNATRRKRLSIMTYPKITALPPPNSTVLVGTNISCVVAAQPPANVTIRAFLPTTVLGFASGLSVATMKVPLKTMAMEILIECDAKNVATLDMKNRRSTKSYYLKVKKLPLAVNLKGVKKGAVGTVVRLSCEAPNAENIDIYSTALQLWASYKPKEGRISRHEGMGFRRVNQLPSQFRDVTIERQKSKHRFDISVRLQKAYDGANVTCMAQNYSASREGKVVLPFAVTWRPSVNEVKVLTPVPGMAMKRFSNVTILCSVDLGNPALPQSTVKATVGIRDLGPSTLNRLPPQPVPANAMSAKSKYVLSLQWMTMLTDGDNGKGVSCTVFNKSHVVATNETKIRVMYPPTIIGLEPAGNAAVLYGSNIRCSADANPPALVVLSSRQKWQPWKELTRGMGSAVAVAVPAVMPPGPHFVRCEAANSEGVATQTDQLIIFKKRPEVALKMMKNPSNSGSFQWISCKTQATEPQLKLLQLHIPSRQLILERFPVKTPEAQTVHYLLPPQDYWVTVRTFPADIDGVTVKPLPAKTNRIDVTLRMKPRDDAKKVTCKAIGASGQAINASVESTLVVRWEPRLRNSLLCKHPMKDEMSVESEVELGSLKGTVFARFDNDEVFPTTLEDRPVDPEGLIWKKAVWKKTSKKFKTLTWGIRWQKKEVLLSVTSQKYEDLVIKRKVIDGWVMDCRQFP